MTNFGEAMHCFREEAICSFQRLPNVGLSMNSLSQRHNWLASMYASSSITLPRSKLETKRLKGSWGTHQAALSCLQEQALQVYQCWLVKYFNFFDVFTLIFFILLRSITLLIDKPLASIRPGKAAYNYLIFGNSWNWSSTYNYSLTVGSYINEFKHSKYKMNLPFRIIQKCWPWSQHQPVFHMPWSKF